MGLKFPNSLLNCSAGLQSLRNPAEPKVNLLMSRSRRWRTTTANFEKTAARRAAKVAAMKETPREKIDYSGWEHKDLVEKIERLELERASYESRYGRASVALLIRLLT